jgi:hypothetical protein
MQNRIAKRKRMKLLVKTDFLNFYCGYGHAIGGPESHLL